jgi:hypothetical protein
MRNLSPCGQVVSRSPQITMDSNRVQQTQVIMSHTLIRHRECVTKHSFLHSERLKILYNLWLIRAKKWFNSHRGKTMAVILKHHRQHWLIRRQFRFTRQKYSFRSSKFCHLALSIQIGREVSARPNPQSNSHSQRCRWTSNHNHPPEGLNKNFVNFTRCKNNMDACFSSLWANRTRVTESGLKSYRPCRRFLCIYRI